MSVPAPDCANDYAQRLRSLPPLPDVAQQIIRKMNDEFVDGNTVADIVAQDPAIAARLIGIANSAYFGLAEPVAEMRQVVNQVLGVDTVRSMAIALATQGLVSTAACPAFDNTRFWRRSLTVGASAQRIASTLSELGAQKRSFSYLLGLCHNLGLLVLANLEAERLQLVFENTDDDNSIETAVIQEFGVSIADLTFALTSHWKLPDILLTTYEVRARNSKPADSLALVLNAAINAARRAAHGSNEDEGDICELEQAGVLSARESDTINEAVRALGR